MNVDRPLRKDNQGVKYRSISFEISFLYSLILGMILLAFSGVLYFVLFRTVHRELDRELKTTAVNICSTINSYLEVRGEEAEPLKFALEKAIADEEKSPRRFLFWTSSFEKRWLQQVDSMDLQEYFINFVSTTKASITRSPNMSEDLIDRIRESVVPSEDGAPTYKTLTYKGRRVRIINYPFTYKDQDHYYVQVGVYQRPIIDLILTFLISVVISIPAILILTSFIGRLLVKRILGPVDEIAAIARKVSHEDLSARVQTRYNYQEVAYLIDDFNDMIGRLENSFAHIEEFTSHAAHELRTPLTVIKGEAELALLNTRSMEEYRQAMNVTLEEVHRMLRIVDDLLLLSKIDYRPEVFIYEQFDFVPYIQEIIQQTEILVRDKHIRLEANISGRAAEIKADRVHLRRLFFNVIDNAIKFTPERGLLKIDVSVKKEYIQIIISDSGIGIPQDEISKIFDRFYRTTNSPRGGHGLGLSIAMSLAHLHKGTIRVTSELNKGTSFFITLPRV
ncbi:MAG: HAMP domain-containing histidine kinase [Candidatus Omnitrophica bacterium]|nr:HAMP domain-containing histidine kinase [Candidatus Omnitrophota bacterium]